jgi:hypothetical protein
MPRLILKIDDAVAAMLDAQVEALSKSQAAREFGVAVNRQVAARVALMRGLSVMGVSGAGPVDAGPVKVDVGEPKTGEADLGPDVDVDEHGQVQPPEGWAKFKSSERVPPEQSDVHEYYEKHGWARWYGNAGGEAISFYWCDKQAHQGLNPWAGKDSKGKSIIVQTTPWGPGHIIPHGWAGL